MNKYEKVLKYAIKHNSLNVRSGVVLHKREPCYSLVYNDGVPFCSKTNREIYRDSSCEVWHGGLESAKPLPNPTTKDNFYLYVLEKKCNQPGCYDARNLDDLLWKDDI